MPESSGESLDALSLAPGLRDPREHIRLASLAESVSSGKSDPSMLKGLAACLNDPNPTARQLAALALGAMGAAAVPNLIEALDERQPVSTRISAASGLSRAGANAMPATKPLAECLDSADDVLRWHAGFALSKIGSSALPILMSKLSSADPRAQCAALDTLGWIGAGAGAAIETVKILCSSTLSTLRFAACSALIRITGDSSAGLPAMLAALDDRDDKVRLAAMQRIGEGGHLTQPAIPKILQSLADPSPSVRAAAALTLARINAKGSEVVQGLTQLVPHPDAEVQAAAAIALSSLGKDAEPSLPQLRTMQNATDPHMAAIGKAAVDRIVQAANK
jgi:HEAT repeat protein